MTEDHWTHVHSAAAGCSAIVPDMSNSSGLNGPIGVSRDNGTYESVLFGDHAVQTIARHDASTPLFLFVAFHNEHDPHQAPRESVDSFPHIKSDVYKVTAALIETMDLQVQVRLQRRVRLPPPAPSAAPELRLQLHLKLRLQLHLKLHLQLHLQVGRILDALNTSGMLANSVIGFSSDNGTERASVGNSRVTKGAS
jgi:hypothetical protein